MGFRFRRSLRIFRGLRLNLSKSGVSTSVGGRGATLNFSNKGIRGTVGLPGSGLSYSDMIYRSGGSGSPSSNKAEMQNQAALDERQSASIPTDEGEELARLYLLTVHLVVESRKASTSWLQRQLRVDYSFAAELLERMEVDGIVSPADRVGRRKVLVDVHSLPELPDNWQSA